MKSIKYIFIAPFLFLMILVSCQKASNSPRECVTSFIISLEQHDMSKAWNLLGKNAQVYYNQLGEKQRRSGKGAFENEINRIATFRSAKYDYSIHSYEGNNDAMKLVVNGGNEFKIEISDEDGEYKIKDEVSVMNIIKVITKEQKPKDYTY